jgi:hypothetical protein
VRGGRRCWPWLELDAIPDAKELLSSAGVGARRIQGRADAVGVVGARAA